MPQRDERIVFFDPDAEIEGFQSNLPHWRQAGVVYFVTFRLADSLPQERLKQWSSERESWLNRHPPPHDANVRREYARLFTDSMQQWLDADYGSCILDIPEVQSIVTNSIRHFDRERYELDEFAVAANHVHVLVSPNRTHTLSEILHSWKSYTAHKILKVEAASRRLRAFEDNRVWQKESFDHIVRSPASLEKFREYIRAHR